MCAVVSGAQQTVNMHMLQTSQTKRVASSNLKSEFDNLLIDSIDRTLSLLWEEAKNNVYSCLKHTFNIEKDAIPQKVVQFQLAIEEIFGTGAAYLETIFIKKITSMSGLALNLSAIDKASPHLTFAEYVFLARKNQEQSHDS